jgi:5-carboxymethyl-2-hydroxymuconate isomerase
VKIVTYTHNDRAYLGVLDGDQVYRGDWQEGLPGLILRGLTLARTSEHVALSEVRLQAPIKPGKMIGVGRNYAAHAEELANTVPTKPLLFAKFPNSVIGTGEAIVWSPALTEQVDWEGELAVIIGKQARNVQESEAYDYVYGYTIANDITARDLQFADEQWVRGKGLDTFCPLGPCIVTRDEIADPHALTIVTQVNGETVQDASTSLMIYRIPHLIAFCSAAFTLEPGDVILTGTPAGVGMGMKPPRYLKDGDVVTVTIDSIGQISNPCRVAHP